MQFRETPIVGVLLVEPSPHRDARGAFARLHCTDEFRDAGLNFEPRQTSLSANLKPRTLRGMHYCTQPETKLVRCVRGRILDVVFDLRPESPDFRKSFGVELDPELMLGLFIPPGVAHGFLTLTDDANVLYQIDRIYRPGFDAGIRWNDPAFAFVWPAEPLVIAPRDATYPDFMC
ncbi:MAG: dTDP-4-dehydrorhamnose 3,5-epimerase family protein [Alphaproteobacteria bacterium]